MSPDKPLSFESLINQTGYKKVKPLSAKKKKVLHIKALNTPDNKEKATTSKTSARIADRLSEVKNDVLDDCKDQSNNVCGNLNYIEDDNINFSIHSRLAKKLSTGKIEIEATIDLHANFVKEARYKLENFIETSYNKQLRNLLIITGKGTGKLREMAVTLFTSKQNRKMVAGYFQAPPRLGGDGAFIVRLRRDKNKN